MNNKAGQIKHYVSMARCANRIMLSFKQRGLIGAAEDCRISKVYSMRMARAIKRTK